MGCTASHMKPSPSRTATRHARLLHRCLEARPARQLHRMDPRAAREEPAAGGGQPALPDLALDRDPQPRLAQERRAMARGFANGGCKCQSAATSASMCSSGIGGQQHRWSSPRCRVPGSGKERGAPPWCTASGLATATARRSLISLSMSACPSGNDVANAARRTGPDGPEGQESRCVGRAWVCLLLTIA